MAKIYGTPIMAGGGGGMNKDLPPLLDNFKAVTGEEENTILVSANKMEESRANELAGAVWVYGDHSPANVNDGTKIQLAREECVLSEEQPVTFASGKTIGDLAVGDKLRVPVNSEYHDFLGENIEWIIADKNHAGYPADSVTLSNEYGLLPLCVDAKEPDNPNGKFQSSGNNQYSISNADLWLNSLDEKWYKPQHDYDAPPIVENISTYNAWNDYPGFCSMLDSSFVNMVLNTDIICALTSLQPGESETITRKFFMPSAHELGVTNSGYLPSISEGSKLAYFNDDSSRIIKPTRECVNNNDPLNTRIQLNNPCGYDIRTPYNNSSYSMITIIADDGNLTNSYPNTTYYSFRVLCNLPSSTLISDNPDADGYYTLQLKETSIKRAIPWNKTKDFYARQFTYNSKKQYQTMLEGALASVIVEGAPAQVTDLVVTGSGGTATLTWVNPVDDPVYAETVVVQKVGSAPSDITDGTEIYRGTDQTCTATGLEQSTDYYFAVYTLNSFGVYKQPVISDVYRYDFPAEPTEWSEVTRITNSQEYIFPETGWFKIVAVAGSGNGAKFVKITDWENYKGYSASGGSGGSGGIAVSKVATQTHDKINITITNKNISIPTLSMSATAGGNSNPVTSGGATSRGGSAGKAKGGNIENINGKVGNAGTTSERDNPATTVYVYGGTPVATSYDTYTTKSGEGGSFSGHELSPSNGSTAYVVILRGNTNTPSPSTASTLSLLPTDSTLTVDWENSGDPVQTGTMLVYNTNHVPTSVNDGVSVDIPVAQTTVSTFAIDGEEQQEDNKKQSYTITGLANNKPVYVALFPYDASKKYGIPKTDVEIPRVHSWYDAQQELQAEVATVKAEMADYQQYYVTTQEVLK